MTTDHERKLADDAVGLLARVGPGGVVLLGYAESQALLARVRELEALLPAAIPDFYTCGCASAPKDDLHAFCPRHKKPLRTTRPNPALLARVRELEAEVRDLRENTP